MDSVSIEAQLDAAHELARTAYARRDAAAYIAMFHPELEYIRADGQTIGRDRLASQIRRQLVNVYRASSAYHREALEASGPDRACGVVEQHATFEVRAFGILHREWTVHRRGRYEWVRSGESWQIRRVEVLSENTTSRTWFGLD